MSAVPSKNATGTLDTYRAAFEASFATSNQLGAMRRAAFARFFAQGWPTQREEAWKYTNLRRLQSRIFKPAEPAPIASEESRWIATAGSRIVLLNGHWAPTLSNAQPQPPGVTILSLGQWMANQPDEAAAFLEASEAGTTGSAFENLNTAFLQDGVVIEIGEGTVLDAPIYVIHQWSPAASSQMSHTRLVLKAGRNSRAALIEHYLGRGENENFTNACVTLDLSSGADIRHYRLQQESTRSFHVGNVRLKLDRNSRYSSHDIALGGSLARLNITALLNGPGALVNLMGLFMPHGTQHIDTQTRIEHIAAHTESNEEYRGIADGKGRGIFNGKIVVHPNAQKIDSRQLSRNLLLSPTAEIDTRPELEIYANDVKCSHGATTGQLDAASLFYLRSRGIAESDARALLVRAFAESILGSIAVTPLRQSLEQSLQERFATTMDSGLKAGGAN